MPCRQVSSIENAEFVDRLYGVIAKVSVCDGCRGDGNDMEGSFWLICEWKSLKNVHSHQRVSL